MAEIDFIFEGTTITIQCNKNQGMKDICDKLSTKIDNDINSLIFLYGGKLLNLDKMYNEITKVNKIAILVYKLENEAYYKSGKILNDKIIDNILSLNNNVSVSLIELKIQVKNMMNNSSYLKNINYIFSQLKKINVIINNMRGNIEKINNQINQFKSNTKMINEQNHKENKDKINNSKNCVINKSMTNDLSSNLFQKKYNTISKIKKNQSNLEKNLVNSEAITLYFIYRDKEFYLDADVDKRIGELIGELNKKYNIPINVSFYSEVDNNLIYLDYKKKINDYPKIINNSNSKIIIINN